MLESSSPALDERIDAVVFCYCASSSGWCEGGGGGEGGCEWLGGVGRSAGWVGGVGQAAARNPKRLSQLVTADDSTRIETSTDTMGTMKIPKLDSAR